MSGGNGGVGGLYSLIARDVRSEIAHIIARDGRSEIAHVIARDVRSEIAHVIARDGRSEIAHLIARDGMAEIIHVIAQILRPPAPPSQLFSFMTSTIEKEMFLFSLAYQHVFFNGISQKGK